MKIDYARKREEMIRRDIMARGIADPRLIAALRKVRRELFVPEKFRSESYRDGPIPIGSDQTISQPYIVAYMTDLLQLSGEEKVLELGTGSGYQAALLCEMAREVYSIEVVEALYERVRYLLLDVLGYQNLVLKRGDGREGWPESQPFDRILLTAAPTQVPATLFEQLAVGGILVAPVGNFIQNIKWFQKGENHQIIKKDLIGVSFVPLR